MEAERRTRTKEKIRVRKSPAYVFLLKCLQMLNSVNIGRATIRI